MMTYALPPVERHNKNTTPGSFSMEFYITLSSKPPFSRKRSPEKKKKGATGKDSLFCNRLTLHRLERQTRSYSDDNTTQRTNIPGYITQSDASKQKGKKQEQAPLQYTLN